MTNSHEEITFEWREGEKESLFDFKCTPKLGLSIAIRHMPIGGTFHCFGFCTSLGQYWRGESSGTLDGAKEKCRNWALLCIKTLNDCEAAARRTSNG